MAGALSDDPISGAEGPGPGAGAWIIDGMAMTMPESQHVKWKLTWRKTLFNAVIHKDYSCGIPIQIRVDKKTI